MSFLTNQVNRVFRTGIAVDLGTAHTLAAITGSDWLLFEPSVACINQASKQVVEVGNAARALAGRTPEHITCLRPLQDGVINEFIGAEALLKMAIQKATSQKRGILRPQVIVGVPSLVSEVEMMALLDAASSAGAGSVFAVYEPVAAALGAGWDFEDNKARLIADIGGGTTDIVVLSRGQILIDKTIKVAGDEMDLAVKQYLQHKYNLVISTFMAEELKIKHASLDLTKTSKRDSFKVLGQDMHSGLPKSVSIRPSEIAEAILPIAQKIVAAVNQAISTCSAEVINDLEQNGVFLAGGGAMLEGIAAFTKQLVGMPVEVVERPQHAVLRGNLELIARSRLLQRLVELGSAFK